MKIIALMLLLVTSAQSQQFGDDNQAGDWLPIPDGYVWPAAADKPPDFTPKSKKLDELEAVQRKAIEDNWPDEKNPERVEIAEVDLNGDGRPEIFVGVPIYSGTGGTFYEILSTKDGKTYASIGGIQGWGFNFLAPKNGWFQIEGMSRGGGGNYTRYLMTFGGDGYEITRNEGHDFNAGKVTIRKTKAEQAGTGQPATRPESASEGGDKPQHESEGRSQ
jgi:hypothetical protein